MGQQLPVKPENGGRVTNGFCTPKQDTKVQTMSVCPARVLPIIFIPGIMGSNLRTNAEIQTRLARKNNIAWRADSKAESLKFWNLNPAERQLQLDPLTTSVDGYDSGHSATGNPAETSEQRNSAVNVPSLYHWQRLNLAPSILLTNDTPGTSNSKTRQQKALERGWGEVLFDSYGTLLQVLEQHLNDPFFGGTEPSQYWKKQILNVSPQTWGASSSTNLRPLSAEELKNALKDCWFPVHAMGYNWLKSNHESGSMIADRVRALIAQYSENKFICEKVILITHSMGGLVARAALHPSIGNLQDKVLGVVHGVMPAIGAGTTYKRIRCGFEGNAASPTRHVLGYSGLEVTAILANSPGGLELLPTKAYGNGWLQAQSFDQTLLKLPKNGDPFEEIYKVQGKWFALLNPAWINFAGSYTSGLDQTIKILDQSKAFHSIIENYYHDNSFAIYGADINRKTWGSVIWKFNAKMNENTINNIILEHDSGIGKLIFTSSPDTDNPNTRIFSTLPATVDASLSPAADPGDQTVPIYSTDTQIPKCSAVFRQTGYEHQASYQDEKSIYATLYSIIKIIEKGKGKQS